MTGLLAILLRELRLAIRQPGQSAMVVITLEFTVGAKILAHWLTTGVPLLIATPVMAVLLNMDASGFWPLIAAMALGTPSISLIGAVGAALTLGANRGGILLSLLVLPLIIPVLIFGAAAVDAAIAGFAPHQQLLLRAAMLFAASILAPWTAAAAIRQAME